MELPHNKYASNRTVEADEKARHNWINMFVQQWIVLEREAQRLGAHVAIYVK